jgi:5'(3')-deoxyribonucleotidase
MSQKATIHLHIDQVLPDGLEEAEEIINRYIDQLAKTDGELSWDFVDWDLFDYDGEQE